MFCIFVYFSDQCQMNIALKESSHFGYSCTQNSSDIRMLGRDAQKTHCFHVAFKKSLIIHTANSLSKRR